MYQIVFKYQNYNQEYFKGQKKKYCRFHKRIGNTLYFVKHFIFGGKLLGFELDLNFLDSIYEIDYYFVHIKDGKPIVHDNNKISISLYEIL